MGYDKQGLSGFRGGADGAAGGDKRAADDGRIPAVLAGKAFRRALRQQAARQEDQDEPAVRDAGGDSLRRCEGDVPGKHRRQGRNRRCH